MNKTISMNPSETNITSNPIESFEGAKEDEDEEEDISREPDEAQDSNEPLENVHTPVVADPPSPTGSNSTTDVDQSSGQPEPEEDNEELDGNQMSRRMFLGNKLAPNSLSDEIKKLKRQRAKLFPKSKRSKRKKPKRKSFIKSTLTRQSSTTVGYSDMNSYLPPQSNSLSSTIKQHFPSLASPLHLSSAVHKLIVNKLGPQTGRGHQSIWPSNLQQSSSVEQHQILTDAEGSNQMSELLNQWASSQEAPSYVSSVRHQRPMIPIEIIGLDPAVTSSILYGTNAANSVQQMSDESNGVSSSMNQHELVPHSSGKPTVVAQRPRASTIFHIHHFHTPGRAEQQSQVDEQEAPTRLRDPAYDNSINQDAVQTAQKVGPKEVFVNEKGELIYLPGSNQNMTGASRTPTNGAEQDDADQRLKLQAGMISATRPFGANNQANIKQQDYSGNFIEGSEPTQMTGEQDMGAGASSEQQSPEPASVQVDQEIQNGPSSQQDVNSNLIYMDSRGQEQPSSADKALGIRHRVYLTTGNGQTINVLSRNPAQNHPEVNADNKQQMLMVSYKPLQNHWKNLTEEASESHRAPFNDGQESFISTKNLTKGANLVLNSFVQSGRQSLPLHPLRTHMGQSELSSRLNGNNLMYPSIQNEFLDANGLRAKLMNNQPLQTPDHRIPFDSSAMRSFDRPIFLNSSEIANARGLWLMPLDEGKLSHLNGYGVRLVNANNINSSNSQQDFIEKLIQLKQQKRINNNPSRLTNEELLSLLQGTKFNGSSLSHNLNVAELSSDSGSKDTKVDSSTIQNFVRTKSTNAIQDAAHNHKVSQNKEHKLNELTNIGDKQNQIQATADEYDPNDTNGLGNFALAFIFIISLITLAIIAASMIYRHKRRSIGRCADLPGRSRITNKTEHFVRSNFVSPNDVVSIKNIDSSPGSSGSVIKISHNPMNNANTTGATSTDTKSADSNRINDRFSSKKSFGHCLSTFNYTPASEKYQFSNDSTEIKTLNTRLHKPSYLRSLISASDSRQSDKRQVNWGQGSEGLCHLNIKNKLAYLSGKQLKSKVKSPKIEGTSESNHTFKNSEWESDGYTLNANPIEKQTKHQSSKLSALNSTDGPSSLSEVKKQSNTVSRAGRQNNLPPKHQIVPVTVNYVNGDPRDRLNTAINHIDKL